MSVYFTAMDLDKSMETVKEYGGRILKYDDNSVGRSAWCEDNQGTQFALHEPNDEICAAHAENPPKGSQNGDLFFFSLRVADETKAQDFFGAVAGWEFGEKGAEGGLGITNLKGPSGGIGCGREGHCASFWFHVDAINESIVLVEEAGGKAEDVFQAPEGTMSECYDNQGVEIGLVEPAAGY